MLQWENGFSQDAFSVTPIDQDVAFLSPGQVNLYSTEARSTENIIENRPFPIKGRDTQWTIITRVADQEEAKTRVLQEVING